MSGKDKFYGEHGRLHQLIIDREKITYDQFVEKVNKAGDIKFSKSFVTDIIKNGKRETKYPKIIQIAQGFNVSADWLLGLSDNPKTIDNPDINIASDTLGWNTWIVEEFAKLKDNTDDQSDRIRAILTVFLNNPDLLLKFHDLYHELTILSAKKDSDIIAKSPYTYEEIKLGKISRFNNELTDYLDRFIAKQEEITEKYTYVEWVKDN